MIVNFENDPRNSLIYTSSIILSYMKKNNGKVGFENLSKYCLEKKMEYSIFILSIDWMFLIGLIDEINNRNELVLCD